MTGNHHNPGPLWASNRELWRSWHTTPLPYDQIVGHTAPYKFNKNRWYDDPPTLRKLKLRPIRADGFTEGVL